MAHAQAAPPLPWSERAAEASPWSPFTAALALAVLLATLFLALSYLFGGLGLLISDEADLGLRQDVRIGVVLCLVVAYLPAAWVSAVQAVRGAVADLEPVLHRPPPERARFLVRVGRYDRRTLRVAGLVGIATAIGIQIVIDWEGEFTLVVVGLPFEAYWHRAATLTIGWMLGRAVHATVVEARRFSWIGRELLEIDLLDPGPRRVLVSRSLQAALLTIGALSLFSLMFYDVDAAPKLGWSLGVLALGSLTVGGVALWLPLRGLRDAIVRAKRRELDWCNEALRRARRALADQEPSAEGRSLADLVAYRNLVESVREWPLDAPALRRFGLYLVIPLASWLGGALVERAVDALIGG